MPADPYTLGKRPSRKPRRKVWWVIGGLILILLIVFGVHTTVAVKDSLKPKTVIKQSAAATSTISYEKKTTTYTFPTFSIDLPVAWKQQPRPAGPYQLYIWNTSDSGTDGQEIAVYQDTIPVNFAVNRTLIVESQGGQLQVGGSVSENCTGFTSAAGAVSGQAGVPAKWQNVNFLCDRVNTTRDVVGTSSAAGINTVVLKGSDGQSHKFFFTYSNHSLNPDYTVFSDVLRSFKMK